ERLLAVGWRHLLASELPVAEAGLEVLLERGGAAPVADRSVVVGNDADALGDALVVNQYRNDDRMRVNRGARLEEPVFELERLGDVGLLVVIFEADLVEA